MLVGLKSMLMSFLAKTAIPDITLKYTLSFIQNPANSVVKSSTVNVQSVLFHYFWGKVMGNRMYINTSFKTIVSTSVYLELGSGNPRNHINGRVTYGPLVTLPPWIVQQIQWPWLPAHYLLQLLKL